MTHLLVPLFLLSALTFIFPANVQAAGDGIVVTEDIQLKLADTFLEEGEYYRAVTEYKKLLILFPGSRKGDYALFSIGMAYYRGDEFRPAAETFASVREKYGEAGYAPVASFYEGQSYVRLNQPEKARESFSRIVTLYPASEYAGTALIALAMLRLEGNDVTGCREELGLFLRKFPSDVRRERVQEAIALLERNHELPRKSPVLAGIMSAVIPGSGHIYAGHYGDGITSFFLNGLFIAGTVLAIQQENYAVAGIVGVIGLPFYVGNIYGAANAATKWNIGVRKELRGKIAVTLDYHF